jgi:hypothetical protein
MGLSGAAALPGQKQEENASAQQDRIERSLKRLGFLAVGRVATSNGSLAPNATDTMPSIRSRA